MRAEQKSLHLDARTRADMWATSKKAGLTKADYTYHQPRGELRRKRKLRTLVIALYSGEFPRARARVIKLYLMAGLRVYWKSGMLVCTRLAKYMFILISDWGGLFQFIYRGESVIPYISNLPDDVETDSFAANKLFAGEMEGDAAH